MTIDPEDLVVPWADFRADPAHYVRVAGFRRVVVLGQHGRPSMSISCPDPGDS